MTKKKKKKKKIFLGLKYKIGYFTILHWLLHCKHGKKICDIIRT